MMVGLSVAVTLLLYWLPYGYVLVYPLLLLSTLAHEMGHGLAAELVGGDFEKFLMWSDGSGVATYSATDSRIGHALIAAGGLVGPAVAAAILFWLARHTHHARRVFAGIGLVLLLLMAFYVRSLFGFAFVAGLAMLAFLFARLAERRDGPAAAGLRGGAAGAGGFLAQPTTSSPRWPTPAAGLMPSDVAQIAEVLFLPYWFWGGACGALFAAGAVVRIPLVLALTLRFRRRSLALDHAMNLKKVVAWRRRPAAGAGPGFGRFRGLFPARRAARAGRRAAAGRALGQATVRFDAYGVPHVGGERARTWPRRSAGCTPTTA